MKKMLLLCGIICSCVANYSFGTESALGFNVPEIRAELIKNRPVNIQKNDFCVQFLPNQSRETLYVNARVTSEALECACTISYRGVLEMTGNISRHLMELTTTVAHVIGEIYPLFKITNIKISNVLGNGVNTWKQDCPYLQTMIRKLPISEEGAIVMLFDDMFNEKCFADEIVDENAL